MTTYDFTGRTAVVTGGTRGIGYATARLLAASGASVLLTSRTAGGEDGAEAAAARIAAETGATVIGLGAHVADPDAATAVCSTAVDRTGRLDILVNNAGTNPAYGPAADQAPALIAKVFEINTAAPVIWTRAALDAGLGAHPDNGSGTGAIVNIASIGALTMEDGIGIYNSSKAALVHLTRQLARELGPAVRVNSICPGIVRTRLSEALWKEHETEVATLTPLGRIGEPEDIADAVAFLAAPSTGWITGTNLVVDGGQLVGTVGH